MEDQVGIEEMLRRAISDGEVLRVVYHGGSQPGAARDIAPIGIQDGKVSARCLLSDAVKIFAIEKLVILKSDSGDHSLLAEWQPGIAKRAQYINVSDLLTEQEARLFQLGWHVQQDTHRISLHRKFKSGKPLKTADVSLE